MPRRSWSAERDGRRTGVSSASSACGTSTRAASSPRSDSSSRRRIGAAELKPVCVQLGLERIAGGSAKQRVKTGLVAESLELVCMVVIDEPQPRGLHSLSEVDGLCPETTVALLRPVGLRKTRDDDVLATPFSALGNHAFEVRVQTLQRDMARASDQIRAPKLFTESPDRRRPKPCHLDGPVADLAQAAQDAAQAQRILEQVPDGVELDRDHGAATRSASSGSRAGLAQVLEMFTRRPFSCDSNIDSITSST